MGPVIVCAADERYAAPLAVLLVGLQQHLKRYPAAQVFILDNGISRRSRRRIEESIDAGKLSLHWIRLRRQMLAGLPLSGHIKPAAYARILIPHLLPDTITKAIYLDVDILVNGDIGELWDLPMEGRPLLAVQEGAKVVSDPAGLTLYRELGIPADTPYLNSGVLVMDVACWRRERISERILEYLRRYRRHVIFHDQDGINAILAGRWGDIGHAWNFGVVCVEPVQGQDDATYSAGVFREARLIHFASAHKPWHAGIHHPSCQWFEEALAKTAFSDWRPTTSKPRARLSRHAIGAYVRRIPLIGTVWARLRRGMSRG